MNGFSFVEPRFPYHSVEISSSNSSISFICCKIYLTKSSIFVNSSKSNNTKIQIEKKYILSYSSYWCNLQAIQLTRAYGP